jgi:hypothetical protein
MDVDGLLQMRSERDRWFAEHYSSPVPEEDLPRFVGLDYFAPDAAWEIDASFEPVDAHKVPVPSTSGIESQYTKLGTATVTIGDATYRLTVLDDGDGEPIIPFRDGTCGRESYGGGRYVGINVTGDRSTIIDFNQTQNPWCVYDAEFTCPLPPTENVISEAIPAGEKMYRSPLRRDDIPT